MKTDTRIENPCYNPGDAERFEYIVIAWNGDEPGAKQAAEISIHVREVAGWIQLLKAPSVECLHIPLLGDDLVTITGSKLDILAQRLRSGRGFILRENGSATSSGVKVNRIVVRSFNRSPDDQPGREQPTPTVNA